MTVLNRSPYALISCSWAAVEEERELPIEKNLTTAYC